MLNILKQKNKNTKNFINKKLISINAEWRTAVRRSRKAAFLRISWIVPGSCQVPISGERGD